ncbi:MAG: hypothetical protein Q8Q38_00345 [bacterium]|nr:hypothetical protein [bacterium]
MKKEAVMQGRMRVLIGVLGFVLVLLVAGGGVALATHGNPNELHACYKNNNGQMRFVGNPADCLPSETAISWNQTGPQGLPGSDGTDGAPGPAGPQGLPGPSGLSDFELVHAVSPLANSPFVAILLPCPAGKQIISGGFDIMSSGGGVIEIVTSAPYSSGWHVRARASANFQNGAWQLQAYALCASVTP